ncbi:WYL domain-containing protein [Dactylosporangium sp. NPDC005555]|uniref:helix-turn-helix transcriptional regulator n=1 Tax=Dactylosporangium sp. NPDC005555 TaxID=3154889 RepID=UPI0033B1DE32
MRASRLISLVLLLQAGGTVTAGELAEALEVSERTIYRDILALSAAGVPVYAEQGRAGGYRLLDGYRTKLNGLSRAEAEALFLSGLPGPARDMGLGDVLAVAELKVAAALPAPIRDASSRARQRFHLDVPGWFEDPAQPPPWLAELARAVWDDRVVRLTYERRLDAARAGQGHRDAAAPARRLDTARTTQGHHDAAAAARPDGTARTTGEQREDRGAGPAGREGATGGGQHAGRGLEREAVTRVVEPYGLVLKNGAWYLVGRVGGDLRVYRVDRIADLTVDEAAFTRDPGFDLGGFWAVRADEFVRRVLAERVTVRLTPAGLRLLRHAVEALAVREATHHPPDELGRVVLDLPVESIGVAYTQLLRLGPEVEVLAPDGLRELMRAAAHRMGELYR